MANDYVWIDGKFYRKAQARVSVFDHGLLYGDGIFEGIRAYYGKIFRCADHIDRLFDSARYIMLDIPYSKKKIEEVMYAAMRKNGLTDAYIRLVVTRGVGDLGLNPRLCKKPGVIVIAAKIQLYPDELYKKGLKVITVPTIRNHNESCCPQVKSLNYLNNILAKIEGLNAGFPEVVMLNSAGSVAECSADNICAIKGKTIRTPSVNSGALPGITLRAALEIAEKLGYTVEWVPNMSRYDLYLADEVFMTGTAAEVISVVEIDGRRIGNGRPGPKTEKILDKFRQIIKE